MAKTLCKSKKVRKAEKKGRTFDDADATHVCRKCGRVAGAKKKLCKPVKLALVELRVAS